ncbi:MAG TPA: hypothetical protein V6D17_01895 [Candidatus Obscuribacterales bacterium]
MVEGAEKLGRNFLRDTSGEGVTEYGTLLAYSALAVALMIVIFNATRVGLISSLSNDVCARMHWVAAKDSGGLN